MTTAAALISFVGVVVYPMKGDKLETLVIEAITLYQRRTGKQPDVIMLHSSWDTISVDGCSIPVVINDLLRPNQVCAGIQPNA